MKKSKHESGPFTPLLTQIDIHMDAWADLSKEALTLQPPPKNISSKTEKKS